MPDRGGKNENFGPNFEPRRPGLYKNAGVAQPFRFLFQKQKVVGSNPIGGTALMFGPAPIARIFRRDSGIRLRPTKNAAIAAGPNHY